VVGAVTPPLILVRALVLLAAAVVLQATLVTRLRLFGVTANLVVVMVILLARWVEPRVALLIGFTSGLVLDLLGASPLGLRALVLTVVAYTSIRFTGDAPLRSVAGVWAISLLAVVMTFVLGTLTGQGSLLQGEIVNRALFVPLMNLGLAALLYPVLAKFLASDRDRAAVL